MPSSLPYTPPHPSTLLILTAFLLSLNVLNDLFDRLISCGLIAQILLGVAFGTPGGNVLGEGVEGAIVGFGYIGLVLVVFEGGLSTSFPSLRANLGLSVTVALTGISLPIALSYVLLRLVDATPLQAFAAGAALCSTSLGTTFTVLGTSGLVKTRMGVVLATAAMLDDVVGLVMVQVIGNLGSEEFQATTVVRPIFVSLGFVVLVVWMAWVAKWVTPKINGWRGRRGQNAIEGEGMNAAERVVRSEALALTVHTGLLIGMVAGAAYAGTSDLFAAYLAGALISWWDSEVAHLEGGEDTGTAVATTRTAIDGTTEKPGAHDKSQKQATSLHATKHSESSGLHIFETYYQPALQRILKPFFFASIGFSIPITQMFQGSTVWRGIVYSVLMFVAKLACGLWLVRIPRLVPVSWQVWKIGGKSVQTAAVTGERAGKSDKRSHDVDGGGNDNGNDKGWSANGVVSTRIENDTGAYIMVNNDSLSTSSEREDVDEHIRGAENRDTEGETAPVNVQHDTQSSSKQNDEAIGSNLHNNFNTNHANSSRQESPQHIQSSTTPTQPNSPRNDTDKDTDPRTAPTQNPISLYPAFIVGAAMTARGEIGFLISSTAQSNGTFSTSSTSSATSNTSEDETSPIFLVVTWAIMLCTIVGPIVVGALVRRVKKLEREAKRGVGGREKDFLGVWGVE